MALDNKLGIPDDTLRSREEEKISKEKIVEMFETGLLDTQEADSFASLKAMHKYLFDEIYNFSGEIRKVNISIRQFQIRFPDVS